VASATVTADTGRGVTTAEQLPDGDGPPGFWWGTDSLPVTVPASAPYSMPYLGGAYGGYIGMTGNWAYWFMGGPGVDPNYNRSTTEASAWGARQAARALSDIANGGRHRLPGRVDGRRAARHRARA
jgi:hypothetical protein